MTINGKVAAGGAQLCVDVFGERGHPVVVLISGAAASMDGWPPDLCRQIAAGGRYVVRYDHRDTGGSTTSPAGSPDYDGGAFERDLVALVQALDLAPAHLVGVSMGGAIAQSTALQHPDLVAGLTLIATTAVGGVGEQEPPAPALSKRFAAPPPDPDWRDRDQVVAWALDAERAFAGPLGVDEDDVRSAAASAFDRSPDAASAGNHWRVVGGDGPPLDVRRIAVPTLVVHGTHDPLFPLSHGRALAGAVPGAQLLVVDGMGHQVPPRITWPTVVPAILDHTAGG